MNSLAFSISLITHLYSQGCLYKMRAIFLILHVLRFVNVVAMEEAICLEHIREFSSYYFYQWLPYTKCSHGAALRWDILYYFKFRIYFAVAWWMDHCFFAFSKCFYSLKVTFVGVLVLLLKSTNLSNVNKQHCYLMNDHLCL